MDNKFILHGSFGSETNIVRKLMDVSGLAYTYVSGEDELVLITPTGKFRGLDMIKCLLAKQKNEVLEQHKQSAGR